MVVVVVLTVVVFGGDRGGDEWGGDGDSGGDGSGIDSGGGGGEWCSGVYTWVFLPRGWSQPRTLVGEVSWTALHVTGAGEFYL